MTHILCQDKASLMYLANQNAIAIHRWLSKYMNPNYPDIMIVDLDPPKDHFELACQGAKLLKESFKKREYQAHVMSTGSNGLHVLSLVMGKKTFEEIREFIRTIVDDIAQKYPHKFTINIQKEKRKNLLYFDILRNAYGQTAIAPYSVRDTKEASIATPLHWEEIDDLKITPRKFTIKNIFDRLKNLPSNPWE